MNSIVLQACNLSVSDGDELILKGSNFIVCSGELTAFCQTVHYKSFLPCLLDGSYTAFKGELLFCGNPVSMKHPIPSIYVGRDDMLIETLSIIENINIISGVRHPFFYSPKNSKQTLTDFCRNIDLPFSLDDRVYELSISQRYVLMILKAIFWKTPLVVLDCISDNINLDDYKTINTLIDIGRRQGQAFVMLTSSYNFMIGQCSRIYFFHRYRLHDMMFQSDYSRRSFCERLFGYPQLLVPANNATVEGGRIAFEATLPEAWYTERQLKIYEGEVFGVLDLCGTIVAQLSQAILDGFPCRIGDKYCETYRDAVCEGLTFATLQRGDPVFDCFTPEENMLLMKLPRLSRGIVLSRRLIYYCIHGELAGLPKLTGRDEADWQRMKILLSRYLLVHPRVLILENPPYDMEESAQLELYNLLIKAAREKCAVIIITTSKTICLNICNRVLAIHSNGNRIMNDPRNDVMLYEDEIYFNL